MIPKRYSQPRKTGVFVAISVGLMLLVHALTPVTPSQTTLSPQTKELESERDYYADVQNIEPAAAPSDPVYDGPHVYEGYVDEEVLPLNVEPDFMPPAPVIVDRSPRLAIIIDDMGLSRERSLKVIDLQGPLTLSFLPYAPRLPEITKKAADKGHDLMLHMPMQPLRASIESGPMTVRTDMSEEAIELTMRQALQSFGGFVGVNNHMGSRATQDRQTMQSVMRIIGQHNLFFVDSRTVEESIAGDVARSMNIPTIRRDIFLDHFEDRASIDNALLHMEAIARRKGYAVAIGHPRDETIAALQAWIPQAQARGFKLVKVGDLIKDQQQSIVKVISKGEEANGPVQPYILDIAR